MPLLLTSCTLTQQSFPAKIRLKVLDEQNQPIQGAEADFSFFQDYQNEYPLVRGKTDASGIFASEFLSIGGQVNCVALKEGIYTSRLDVNLRYAPKDLL